MPVSGSNAAPVQSAPPTDPDSWIVPCVPLGSALTTDGGVNNGPVTKCLVSSIACARSSGVKSIRSSTLSPWRSNAGGLVGNSCVGEAFSPGTADAGTGRSSIGHTGLPVTRSST